MSAKKSSTSAKKAQPETFDTREVVLGKIRGFPPWPGMVVDPETVPEAVSKERPASKKSAVYAVRFFPTGDYAWLPPKELKRLTPGEIAAFVEGGAAGGGGRKTGDLMEGYRKALDPEAWEEEHAANPPAAKRRKSNSKAKKREDGDEKDELAADEAADEEDEEAAEDEEQKVGKKRKRAGSDAPAKGKAKPKALKATAAKNGKKSKAVVESEDDAAEEAEAEGEEKRVAKKSKVADGVSELESDPEALRVREWRHKLQKIFLSNKSGGPKEDEMPAVDTLFTTVEEFQNMTIGYLTFSKIGKVMRHIHLLEPHKVPRDDEFKFRDRAKALVDKWHQILNANTTGGDGEVASADVTEGTARMDLNGAAGEGDLTVMDVTMDEAAEA
ncbi:hypothetical protein C8R43DRAFT_1006428 [Mycena crocata]|nr:hypothetical protein C8R43DRAFT_1006428 [Mycena crocata]